MPKSLSGEQRRAKQNRANEKERLLGIVEGADEQVVNLDAAIRTFVEINAESIRRDPNLNVPEGNFNDRIDTVVLEIWQTLECILPLLPQVAVTSTCIPAIWCANFQHPMVACGPEEKPALPIIDALEPYAHHDSALLDLLRNLITITGNSDRHLVLMPPEVRTVFNRPLPEPEPEEFTIGFIANPYTDIQRAMFKSGDVILAKPNAVVPFLGGIVEAVGDFIERSI
ncbi:MAG: hypothetical protein KGJ53_10565 [Alphaproteobacteria bacterium]|nr:hypothetical protein [Alphaproteobacteria bacterium]